MSSFLPQLNTTAKSQSVQQEFRGLNHNAYLENTEFYDMKNMSVDNYPYASPRKKRSVFLDKNGNTFGQYTYDTGETVQSNGIATKQGFCFVEGNRFYYKKVDEEEYHDIGPVSDGEKTFVSLGAYILIFPDKKYFWSIMYNHYDDVQWLKAHGLEQSEYFGNLEATKEFETVNMKMCNVYGEDYEFDYIQTDIPNENVHNGAMWLDTSSAPAKMMKYSETYSGWLEITSNYIKVTVEGDITGIFKGYDGVTLSGFPKTLGDFNSATVMYIVDETADGSSSYFVIPGIISPQSAEEDGITYNSEDNSITYTADATKELTNIKIERKIPDMDYVCELDNRLWGCSNENHEIYSSKLGDPFNFNFYLGLSTDSYTATIGSDGDFTGCIAHLGYILFFKEDCVHKIYGTKPTNYQITNVTLRGVQSGCSKSMCIVNETLFYKSKSGVMMYQGSLPEAIGDELGTDAYYDAVAGTCGNKYYISMRDKTNTWWLFVYDTITGLWHKEDNTRFKYVLSTQTELYYIDGNDCSLKTINGTGENFVVHRLVDKDQYVSTEYKQTQEEEFEWSCETGDLYEGNIDHKYISRLRVLMDIYKDTTVDIFLKYDNQKDWARICTKHYKYAGNDKRTQYIPINPRRCQRLKVKISGKGYCHIIAIAKNIEQGSEL